MPFISKRKRWMPDGALYVPSGGGAFQGAGDVVSGAVSYWGLRAYTSASIGGNAVQLRESGGDTLQTFATIAGGGLDLSAISSFKGSNSLFVHTLYDQTGNGHDLTQTNNAQQPAFVLSAVNSLPAIGFTAASSHVLPAASYSSASQPCTVVGIFKHTASGGQQVWLGNDNGVGIQSRSTADNQVSLWAGSAAAPLVTASDGAFHSLQALFNGSSSTITVDGSTSATGNPGSAGFTTSSIFLGADGSGAGQFFDGYLAEIASYGSSFSGGQLTSMYSNHTNYYGV